MHSIPSCEAECGTGRSHMVGTRPDRPMLYRRQLSHWCCLAWAPRVHLSAYGFAWYKSLLLKQECVWSLSAQFNLRHSLEFFIRIILSTESYKVAFFCLCEDLCLMYYLSPFSFVSVKTCVYVLLVAVSE